MHKLVKFLGASSAIFAPFAAMAGGLPPAGVPTTGTTVFSILAIIANILNFVIPILITLGVIYVIWGVIKYATAKESGEQDEARKTIISGIIALFVIVSIWGLVAILNSTFGIDQGGIGVGSDCIPGTLIGVDPLGNPIVCP